MKIKLLRILLAGVFVLGLFSMVQAAKPQKSGSGGDVIAMSNGFPSGLHFNLNLHGRDYNYLCVDEIGGKSVFIPLYGSSVIQYVSNKKSSNYDLMVLDSCSEDFTDPPDPDPIKVFLPQKVWPDEALAPINADGYYVFARILAKPNNGNNKPESNIILYPNTLNQACNFLNPPPEPPAEDPYADYTECEGDLPLGLLYGANQYIVDEENYVRFDPDSTGGKGKSKATDITRLFTYTGWVVDETLDTYPPGDPSGDGVIDFNDVPLGDYDGDGLEAEPTPPNHDFNNDGYEDKDDVDAWLDTQTLAWYIEDEWIFNVADLVVTDQVLKNDGTKLIQIRFYPVSTTEYNDE